MNAVAVRSAAPEQRKGDSQQQQESPTSIFGFAAPLLAACAAEEGAGRRSDCGRPVQSSLLSTLLRSCNSSSLEHSATVDDETGEGCTDEEDECEEDEDDEEEEYDAPAEAYQQHHDVVDAYQHQHHQPSLLLTADRSAASESSRAAPSCRRVAAACTLERRASAPVDVPNTTYYRDQEFIAARARLQWQRQCYRIRQEQQEAQEAQQRGGRC